MFICNKHNKGEDKVKIFWVIAREKLEIPAVIIGLEVSHGL